MKIKLGYLAYTHFKKNPFSEFLDFASKLLYNNKNMLLSLRNNISGNDSISTETQFAKKETNFGEQDVHI